MHPQKALRSNQDLFIERHLRTCLSSQLQSVIHLLPAPFTDTWVGADTQMCVFLRTRIRALSLFQCVVKLFWSVCIIFGLISFCASLLFFFHKDLLFKNHSVTHLSWLSENPIRVLKLQTHWSVLAHQSPFPSSSVSPWLYLLCSLTLSYQRWWL